MKNKAICLGLFFLSIVLFALSQPSLFFEDGLSFCAWFAYIPFFLLLDRISLVSSPLWGAAYGAFSYFLLCWWLSAFGLVAISFVCFLFAVYNAILFTLVSFAKRLFPKSLSKFFWVWRAGLVLSVEFIRTHGIFAFSYGIIGYSQWKSPLFLHSASFLGVFGISFLILLVNSLVALVVSERNLRTHLSKCAFLCAILLSLVLAWKIHAFFLRTAGQDSISVVLVQDASSASSRSISQYNEDFLLLKRLTDEALLLNPDTELVVWPETAIVPDILYHLDKGGDSARHALALAVYSYIRSKSCAFLIGNNHRDEKGEHNSALYFSPDYPEIGIYDKNHLVPFTEFWPDFLDFPVFDGIKGSLDCEFFSHGSGIRTFSIRTSLGRDLRFSVPICFEDSFSSLMRRMKLDGADFFVNISDDAWAREKSAQNMHLSMSAFRCAEFATPMIRSTIDGKTCVIGVDGLVVSAMESGIDGFLYERCMIPAKTASFYSIVGEWYLWIFSVLVFLSVLILSVRFVKVRVYGRR
ncbi:MAG: apolipoprotein N-acyltransferase [Treponema sp.]|uniref:apolipoprotein N-acyltransferase n=1 Tax=Treponema sp. TaxID=166 RepID=UPI0025FBE36D|nr:apolipoprotein N-acyltransferase [Treponema sp.]MBQ9281023.1 apolipoprotein N-acyltransferase [Treponema sp.]